MGRSKTGTAMQSGGGGGAGRFSPKILLDSDWLLSAKVPVLAPLFMFSPLFTLWCRGCTRNFIPINSFKSFDSMS